jgi:hypothetical protein
LEAETSQLMGIGKPLDSLFCLKESRMAIAILKSRMAQVPSVSFEMLLAVNLFH